MTPFMNVDFNSLNIGGFWDQNIDYSTPFFNIDYNTLGFGGFGGFGFPMGFGGFDMFPGFGFGGFPMFGF